MNAPTPADHLLLPTQTIRDVPEALIDALRQRFGAACSTALVVREQHGRDESPFTHIAPPAASNSHFDFLMGSEAGFRS